MSPVGARSAPQPRSIPCGQRACSRWTAQQPHSEGRFAPQREQAPSPQVRCSSLTAQHCVQKARFACVGGLAINATYPIPACQEPSAWLLISRASSSFL
ncbi:hypothetical protein FIV36_10740 [Pseudomonas extremaustralis]|uniref:Uncharacterized protein n=1 Tax=Pseudomonas extremaustralis TaxID=359110 RepID=A0A5C5QI39_9PSED|nr:hypothetical protein FIV36_10740 [Pseudomonas extremaustralis]